MFKLIIKSQHKNKKANYLKFKKIDIYVVNIDIVTTYFVPSATSVVFLSKKTIQNVKRLIT
jgi:hypothetical protein